MGSPMGGSLDPAGDHSGLAGPVACGGHSLVPREEPPCLSAGAHLALGLRRAWLMQWACGSRPKQAPASVLGVSLPSPHHPTHAPRKHRGEALTASFPPVGGFGEPLVGCSEGPPCRAKCRPSWRRPLSSPAFPRTPLSVAWDPGTSELHTAPWAQAEVRGWIMDEEVCTVSGISVPTSEGKQ